MIRPIRFLLAAASLVAICAAPDVFAQTYPPLPPAQPPAKRIEVTAFTGWMVNGDVDTSGGKLVMDDAQSFGASFAVLARPGTRGEFIWTYSRNDARIDSFTVAFPSSRTFSVDTNYFQIGGLQSIRRGRLEPFAGATLGAVWYSPENVQSTNGNFTYNLNDTWRFAFTVGGGANIFLNQSQSLALHLHARMMVPVFFSSAGFYVGSGGSGMTVSGGIPAVSGDFGVGLVLAR